MTPDAEKLQALHNDLAAVLIEHKACGIIVYACAAGDGSAQIMTPVVVHAPRLDGGVDEGVAVPRKVWDKVINRVLRIAEQIKRARESQ